MKVARDSLSELGEESELRDTLVPAVQRGESVRIVGLGTLVRRYTDPTIEENPCDCRLTLTAAVAPRAGAYTSPEWALPTDLHADVRHLARALCSPIEVWSPARKGSTGWGSNHRHGDTVAKHITTVQP